MTWHICDQNLADSVDNVGLKDVFKKFGEILSCKVAMSDDGKSRGHGFVQFDSEDSANAAIENLNGSDVGGKKMYVVPFFILSALDYNFSFWWKIALSEAHLSCFSPGYGNSVVQLCGEICEEE